MRSGSRRHHPLVHGTGQQTCELCREIASRLWRAGAFIAVQAVPDLKLIPIARQTLDAAHFPRRDWWIFAPIKAAAGFAVLFATVTAKVPAVSR